MFKRFIGDKAFYKMVIAITLPLIIQNAVTNLVSLVDNLMIGSVGTLAMSAVSISNQLILIFTLATFGSIASTGIFSAQYAGKKDYQGVKNCMNLKVYISLIISAVFITGFLLFGKGLISSYLDPATNSAEDILITSDYAWTYMFIMLFSMVPFGLKEAFSSTIRESGETVYPMVASSIALITNAVLNYILIFGKFGLPQLGVVGAALATVISRFVEFGIIVYICIKSKDRFPFLQQPFKNVTITIDLVKNVVIKGAPLVANEVLWSAGIAGINQCYSTRSLIAMAVITIVGTIGNLYSIVCNALGNSISIIVGQALGTGDKEKAMDTDFKMIFFNVCLSLVVGTVCFFISPLFPGLYNTTDEIKSIATVLLQVIAIKLPLQAIYMSSYFTLRSGGKTVITFLFDSGFTCLICWPLAYVLAHFTTMSLTAMYIAVTLTDVIKVMLGLYLVGKGSWVNTLVNE